MEIDSAGGYYIDPEGLRDEIAGSTPLIELFDQAVAIEVAKWLKTIIEKGWFCFAWRSDNLDIQFNPEIPGKSTLEKYSGMDVPIFKTNLREMCAFSIDMCKETGDCIEDVRDLAAGLKIFVTELESVIEIGQKLRDE